MQGAAIGMDRRFSGKGSGFRRMGTFWTPLRPEAAEGDLQDDMPNNL
jgi:hypothetical protein